MVLNNTLIIRGNYDEIKNIKEEVNRFTTKPNSSTLFNNNTKKFIKKMVIKDEVEVNGKYNLVLKFIYRNTNINDLLSAFDIYPVEIIHMCENEKNEVWIVNKREYIPVYHLIPAFAVHRILLDFMEYKDSAIILDSFETIKYDLNNKQISVDNNILTHEELLILLFEKTIKGRYFYDIIENFVINYYDKCINNYEELYSINKESSKPEETTTPLALFIVTFGLFALILVLLKVMGYI